MTIVAPKRYMCSACFATALFAAVAVQAATKVWDGGNGFWDQSRWNGGGPAPLLNGTDDAIINSGTVTYETFGASDFSIGEGSSLTVGPGGAWVNTDPEWSEIDGSLTIDGGTFSRTGGGAFIFGSFLGNDSESVSLTVRNGGSMIQRGEMWLGYWENTVDNLSVTITVDNGTIDLGPASDPNTGEPFTNASLFFIDPTNDPNWSNSGGISPKYAINFTGVTGTMIVGANGLVAPAWDASAGGYAFPPLSYQNLWDLGLIQRNGQSGLTGGAFSQFFTVTGQIDQPGYTLSVGGSLVGDYDRDGDVGPDDYNVWANNYGATPSLGDSADGNADGVIDSADYTVWRDALSTSPALAVPEPTSLVAIAVATLASATRRPRQF